MTQPLLFDAPPAHTLPAHQRHSETSKAAAVAIQPHLGRQQYAVWLWLKDHPGSTDNEIIAGVGGNPNGPRARRVELTRKGMVVAVSEREGSTTWRVA